ncbi:MAG: transcriptional repressor NrdR [Thermoanaerobaculaceae bacterium]|nr:transcriptional repressor NrdR [Thermoanaerobaculaceae bacterium]MDI9621154.1 transcriptional regulator NrdR [Acidobacteriota bacterium]NLH10715.1 transcriptional repressor NrdR [Holophagae bacterium]HPW55673.1 transcriptional regulator NrdR [Thermoanaerobaculaceae bacterium]
MRCPFCAHPEDRVVDSREHAEGSQVRRRRECLKCCRRFTTYERLEETPALVIKRDGRREPYDRAKVLDGLLRACQKRPVSQAQIEAMADAVELAQHRKDDREIASQEIGRILMQRLREIDQVSYVRFASVYRRFEDVEQFVEELRLLRRKGKGAR